MALPSVDYSRRDPAADVLHRVVREHLQTFLAEAAHLRDGEGAPRFVVEEFQAFLTCGWLAGGFARFQCAACKADLCKAVVRVLLREVHRHLRTRARERGLADARGGAVAIVQRFPPHCAQSAQRGPRGLVAR